MFDIAQFIEKNFSNSSVRWEDRFEQLISSERNLKVGRSNRELRAHVFLGLSPGPDPRRVKNLGPGRPTYTRCFFTNIQHPVCTWTNRDHGLTTYNWLLEEKNRYTIISYCSFLSINASKIKFSLSWKKRIKVAYVEFSPTVFRFQAKIKLGLVKTKYEPGFEKKIFGPGPDPKMPAAPWCWSI